MTTPPPRSGWTPTRSSIICAAWSTARSCAGSPPSSSIAGRGSRRMEWVSGRFPRIRFSMSAHGWPLSAGSLTATSAPPTRTGPTRSSRWPTAARRRSATRSSTRSPRTPAWTSARRSTRRPSSRRSGSCTSPTTSSAGKLSTGLFSRAQAVLPGGVNSPVRAMRSIGRDPIFIAGGQGAELVDVDGNRYVDYVCSWGPLIAGHAHPAVLEAVTAAAACGTSFGAPTEGEVELAEEVVARIPSAEMIRMTSSGTEASMSAIRLARAVTGRDPILKFAGAYHGHVDGLLADAGSGLATQGIPASPGVTQAAASDTEIVPWNDPDAVSQALHERPPAAIIAEPAPANMGLVPASAGFLEFLRAAADESGTLLIFDEVISGFRVGRGGMQERTGVTPDLTILGKVIGGGLPAAAYAGRADLMERIAPAGDVYQAGTL